MIAPNDRPTKAVQPRSGRRKGAAWKSGLVLTGLGAVVLGAGYLAGVNAPAVNATAGASVTTLPIAQAPAGRASANEDGGRTSPQALGSRATLFLGYDEEGNAVYLKSDGSLEFGAEGDLSENDQFGVQPGRQSPSFGQQQPNFRRPMTRSRGS